MRKSVWLVILVIVLVFNDILPNNCINVWASTDELSSYKINNNFENEIILKEYNVAFKNIKSRLQSIKDSGYTVIEVSQIQGTKDNTLEYDNQDIMRQPINQKIGNFQLGTKEELQSLCEEAHNCGIKIIVEVELNHMAWNNSKDGLNPKVDYDMQGEDLYHNLGKCTNPNDRWEITQKDINGIDLNTQNPMVQDMALNFLNECVDVGVDGFRINDADSIETESGIDSDKVWSSDYWRYVLGNLKNRDKLLIYANTSKINYENSEIYNFISLASEESCLLLNDSIRNKDISKDEFNGCGKIKYYEDNNNYILNGINNLNDDERKLGYALNSARDVTPVFFVRPAGNIGESSDDFYENEDIKTLNKFHIDMKGKTEYITDNKNTIVISRGSKNAVIVNLGDNTTVEQETGLEDGTYENIMKPNGEFTVNNGIIRGNIGENQCAVLDKTKVTSNKTVIYYSGYDNPYIHYKINNGQWTAAPGVKMTASNDVDGYGYMIELDIGQETGMTACFNNGNGSWDSNGGNNYTFGTGYYTYKNGVITKITKK